NTRITILILVILVIFIVLANGVCLLKRSSRCLEVRWTTGDRLFSISNKKCIGAQGKSVGSEVNLYDCDDKSVLQKWECKNQTQLALKGTDFYIAANTDESIGLTKSPGPNSHFTITGTSSSACTRTYREFYTIEGNGFGKICMFPFQYKDRWFGDCTTYDSSTKRAWCAVGTRYENDQWGYCPTSNTDHWTRNLITGAYYQLNTQSVLTRSQAETSCKQQGAALLSVVDPNEQAFIAALLASGKHKLWIGLVLNPEHGWQWSDAKPFRYLRWSCLISPIQSLISWFFSSLVEQGFCPSPWIPYNGHCFQLIRQAQTWSGAQKGCRKEGGDLVSIYHVEDQSFVISQLGYASIDELWIGLNDVRTEGLFDWSDHSAVTFTSWEFGKPAASTDADDCVLIRGEVWNRWCDETHGFICMKQSETERPAEEVELDRGCKAGWKRHGSYCYFVGTETMTFDEAKEDCKSKDSYLADVSNGVDNAFLVSLVGLRSEKHFWLGLSNQKNIDEFVWTNNVLVSYTHWNTDMPGYQQGCVAMTTGTLAGLWDLLPCANREKHICKHLAEGAVLTSAPPTQSPPKCEEGWVRVGTRSVCSKFFTGPRSDEKTWYEARDYCRAIGGDLLSIHSESDSHGKAWIGLHIPDSGSGFTWSDGTALNFQHWQEGEPNNHNNDESCAEFRIYHWDEPGSWNDANCESYNDWMCQIRAGLTPKPPPNNTVVDFTTSHDGWLGWRGNQYFINRNQMSMEDAQHYCQQRHGDLVSITSKEENTFIWKQISRSYGHFYIGLTVELDGSYWFMDGSPVGIQKWDENQPNANSYDQNCVAMTYYMGFWQTCNCGQEYSFICKRGNSAPANTTAIPTPAPKGGCPMKWTKFDSKVRNNSFLITRVAELASGDVWIGLNSLNQDGYFWTDGKKRKYTNWGYSVKSANPVTINFPLILENKVHLSSTLSLLSTDPNIHPLPVPAIPTTYLSLGNDSIKVVTKNLTWEDAKKHCEGDKANLASLRRDWTQAYVELQSMNLKTPLWIGLNKEQTGGYFKYIDGWHLNFASWAEGEPRTGLPCVYVDVDGQWKTALCNQTMNSVCMQSIDVPPTQSTIFPGVCPEDTTVEYQQTASWLPFKGHCYLFMTEEIEWADAASSCVRHGGILASIEDPEEQQFIKSNVEIFQDSVSAFWVGLFKTHKGKWLWLDKTVMDYTNWGPDEPENDYGEIGASDGAWRTGRRWHDRGYICETPKGSDITHPIEGQDPRSRVHTSLIVVLIITITSTLMAFAFFLYKKAPRALPTFDNPLYFGSERSQPDVVDTNKLIENAEVENPEPIIAL
uniref:Mannose receptor, C type 1b n=1 Tax=Labrus bergylta TaxID=56723 RepID=A0A3Q3MEK2_9LABR